MTLPILLVSQNQKQIDEEIVSILNLHGLKIDHPDLMYSSEKMGIEAIKKIHQHLSWKPVMAKYRVVVISPADTLTSDAQNALLKVLEEPSENALIILSVNNEDVLLETVRSRIEVRYLDILPGEIKTDFKFLSDLLELDVPERLEKIEKNDDRKKLVADLAGYYYQKIPESTASIEDLKLILLSESWIRQNVSAKAVSDFLMIKLTKAVK